MNRGAHSFFAAFTGWLVPFLGLMLWMQFAQSGQGYITDFEFFLFWPLFFTGLGWLIIGLPIALIFGADSSHPIWKIILITTSATTAFFLCINTLYQQMLLPLIWWPVLIGIIGGGVYWTLQRYQPLKGWVFWLIPLIFFPFVRFALLPVGIAYFPYTTYLLAEGAIGHEALIQIIRQVRVGDTYEELHRKYPKIFDQPVLGTSWYGSGWSYSVRFDELRERVVSVKITPVAKGERGSIGQQDANPESK